MVTINITRKDSCENARMCVSVTALDRHSRCTVRCSQRPLYTGTNTRYASMHTNSVSKQHDTYGIISLRHRLFHPNFRGVHIAPDRLCWGQHE